ncbi:hypothetical protein DR994_03770 [Streptococcus thermophilus]|nr:hypothetical protein [Streptococcus thermophilus]MCT2889177.1 hypothetical protein [Streptococcus thermophilus]MCT2905761.1 hypothetical protein [Streptococcus thermophilus]MCT2913922.1 hypothetical protein [Streptococcus thermophilus]MCT2959676.1 hypothetical protein [Streptococcus thermophilus]
MDIFFHVKIFPFCHGTFRTIVFLTILVYQKLVLLTSLFYYFLGKSNLVYASCLEAVIIFINYDCFKIRL